MKIVDYLTPIDWANISGINIVQEAILAVSRGQPIHFISFLKGEGNYQHTLSWVNSSPPLLPKYIDEKAHNAP